MSSSNYDSDSRSDFRYCGDCGALEGDNHKITCDSSREHCHQAGWGWEECFVERAWPTDLPIFTRESSSNLLQVAVAEAHSLSGLLFTVIDMSRIWYVTNHEGEQIKVEPCEYEFHDLDAICTLEKGHDAPHMPLSGYLLAKMRELAPNKAFFPLIVNISRTRPMSDSIQEVARAKASSI